METTSLGGARYFLTFIDDYSRMCFIYFIKTKDETFSKFKEFKNFAENQQNTSIKVLRTDNGGEYCSKEFQMYTWASFIREQTATRLNKMGWLSDSIEHS
uniref:Integrase catalytic domain-containing protein n=1 Tax=Photinus pyralis TaxID=7054 RepID=A0A1Y1KIF8_PHOPY